MTGKWNISRPIKRNKMVEIDTHEHRMAKGTLYLMGANIIFLITGYIIHFGAGRWFGPADYGRFGVILVMLSIVEILVSSGIPQAVSKFIAENEKYAYHIKNAALTIQIIFSLALFSFYLLFAPTIAEILNDVELTRYIQLSAFDIPIFAVFLIYSNGVLGGLREFGIQSKVLMIYSGVKVASILLFLLIGYGLFGAIVGYILASAIGLIIAQFYCKLNKYRVYFPSKRIIRFAVPIIIFSVALMILMSLDLIFVQAIIGDNEETGFYTTATVIARLPYFIFLALSVTLLPSVSKSMGKGDMKQTRQYIRNSLRYMLMLVVPATFLISATSTNLISLVYSHVYEPGGPSLGILIFGLTFLSVFVILTTIITAGNEPNISMTFALLLIPIYFILNLRLIPLYNLEGAALATTITGFIGFVIAAIYVRKRFGALMEPGSFANILGASLIIYLIISNVPSDGPMLVLVYPAVILIYFAILAAIKEITRDDIDLFLNMVKTKKQG